MPAGPDAALLRRGLCRDGKHLLSRRSGDRQWNLLSGRRNSSRRRLPADSFHAARPLLLRRRPDFDDERPVLRHGKHQHAGNLLRPSSQSASNLTLRFFSWSTLPPCAPPGRDASVRDKSNPTRSAQSAIRPSATLSATPPLHPPGERPTSANEAYLRQRAGPYRVTRYFGLADRRAHPRCKADEAPNADPHHSYSAPTPAEAPPVASMAPFAFNCL
jgi:hypothetical protein